MASHTAPLQKKLVKIRQQFLELSC